MASAFCVLSKKSFLHFKFINFLLYVFLSFISLSFMQLKFYYQKFNFSYTKTKVLYLQLLCQGLRITFILITYPTFLFMKEIQHCLLSDAPFIRHHLFPWNSFDTLLKIQLTIYMCSLFFPINLFPILTPIPHYLDYCSSISIQKSSISPLTFFLCVNYFVCPFFLHVHMHFSIRLSMFTIGFQWNLYEPIT